MVVPAAAEASATTELALFGVLVAVAALLLVAHRSQVPYPILLVVGGGALGFVPGLPDVRLSPDVVLLVFLPPLLYAASFFSSVHDLREHVHSISLLATGCVLLTMAGVAVVAHAVVDLPWAAAFTLGAVLSPTDAIAATAIADRVGAPRRVVTVVEGESLANDATGLIAFRFAVAAAVDGTFNLWSAVGTFALSAVVGIAIGVVVAWVVRRIRQRVHDAPIEIVVTLMTPYLAYLPAEAAGVSGVLAAVTTGIYLGWHSPALAAPTTRISSFAVWDLLVFALNAALFVLVGLQLPRVIDGVHGDVSTWHLVVDALAVCATVIAARFVWVLGATVPVRHLVHSEDVRELARRWREPLLIAWIGMRGGVSLAAALAVPMTIDGGGPFPDRDLIVFLTYTAILVTLVAQGLTLPVLLRGVDDDGGAEADHEARARIRAARAALARLDELAGEAWVRDGTLERMRGLYDFRIRRFSAHLDPHDRGEIEEGSQAYQRLRREILEAERAEVVRLRNEGRLGEGVMRRIERDLDLEDARLEI